MSYYQDVVEVDAPATDSGVAAASLEGCWKAFGARIGLYPTWLQLLPGSFAMVVGANAAGKTTLLRLVAGVLRPSGGKRRAAGPGLYLAAGDGGRPAQTVQAAVRFAESVGFGSAEAALALVGCEDLADERVAELSSGQRARMTLAVAVAAAPAVVCLDEPASHLDTDGQEALGRAVEALRERSAVLAATPARDAAGNGADVWLRLAGGRVEEVL